MDFQFRPLTVDEFPKDCLRLFLRMDGEPCFVDVPEAFIASILQRWDMTPAGVSDRSLLLVIEYICDELLTLIERQSAAKITCEGVSRRERASEPAELYGICEFAGESFPIGLRLPSQRALPLAEALKSASRPYHAITPGIEVAFRLGTTLVSARVLRKVKPGDAIVGDQMLRDGKVAMIAGERFLAAGQWQGNRVSITTKPAPVSRVEEETWSMADLGSGQGWARSDADAGFEDIQIKLLFEFARTEMRLEELQKLGPGYVFDFSKSPKTAIDIFAGSRRIGCGEVVQVGDALAVRVTRLFNNE